MREAESHRIVDDRHDDRDRARRLFYGAGRRFAAGDNHIWFQRGKLGRERREPPIVALRRAHLQCYILAFDIAEFVEAVPESPEVYLGDPRVEKRDERLCMLLC